MRRFAHFRTGTSRSSGEDRQAALTGAMGQVAGGLNGKLRKGGVLGDGTVTAGNSNEKTVPGVKFQKPDVPVLVVHRIGHTVYNWQAIDVKPAAIIGRARRRPTRDGIWLEAKATGATVDPVTGKFDPPIVATIACWGEAGQEPHRPRSR